jgi:citrate lyase beta subunit
MESFMSMVSKDEAMRGILARLSVANREFAEAYPGERADRQPVHSVYGGAHLFRADTAARLGAIALRMFDTYAPDAAALAAALGMEPALAALVHPRVREKLAREPVEDYRLDFEDGYGNRPDPEEDGHARSAAEEVAKGMKAGTLPPFIGIRIKPLNEELRARSLRTLDLFLGTLLANSGGTLPGGFAITLPKITRVEQVEAFADVLDLFERGAGLAPGTLAIELMIETPHSILAPDGSVVIPRLVAAARGRCRGAHFGTYDYTAGVSITAAHQQPSHPACDFARHVMQVSLAGTGVTLSDGATTIMPVGPHREEEGRPLSAAQRAENMAAVHRAWKIHYDDVRSSLRHAYYQGWDLNPGQLPTRYAAVFSFFLESREEAAARLRAFMGKAAQATLLGDVFDDAATGQGLLNYFLRGMSCGAVTEAEALDTGLTIEEFRSRSFVKILKGRQG